MFSRPIIINNLIHIVSCYHLINHMPFFDIEDVLKFSVIPKHEDLTKPCLSVLDIYDPIIKKQEFRFRAGGKDLSSNIKDVEQMVQRRKSTI